MRSHSVGRRTPPLRPVPFAGRSLIGDRTSDERHEACEKNPLYFHSYLPYSAGDVLSIGIANWSFPFFIHVSSVPTFGLLISVKY